MDIGMHNVGRKRAELAGSARMRVSDRNGRDALSENGFTRATHRVPPLVSINFSTTSFAGSSEPRKGVERAEERGPVSGKRHFARSIPRNYHRR